MDVQYTMREHLFNNLDIVVYLLVSYAIYRLVTYITGPLPEYTPEVRTWEQRDMLADELRERLQDDEVRAAIIEEMAVIFIMFFTWLIGTIMFRHRLIDVAAQLLQVFANKAWEILSDIM